MPDCNIVETICLIFFSVITWWSFVIFQQMQSRCAKCFVIFLLHSKKRTSRCYCKTPVKNNKWIKLNIADMQDCVVSHLWSLHQRCLCLSTKTFLESWAGITIYIVWSNRTKKQGQPSKKWPNRVGRKDSEHLVARC